jgi:hypothetical protein
MCVFFCLYVVWFCISTEGFQQNSNYTNSVAPEPEGSSPHSPEPTKDPYPEPGESTPRVPNQSPYGTFFIPSSHLRLVFQFNKIVWYDLSAVYVWI